MFISKFTYEALYTVSGLFSTCFTEISLKKTHRKKLNKTSLHTETEMTQCNIVNMNIVFSLAKQNANKDHP